MAFIGSDVQEVTYNHPVLGSGKFSCKAGEGYKIDLGGQRVGDDTGMVTGQGKRINQMTMKASKFELPPIAWDKTDANELQKLTDLCANSIGSTWTVQCLDGSIYQMKNGHPAGDIAGDGYAGTIPLVLIGDAFASRIS